MSGKTLSNGTLSLRFMQNAQQAKLQAQVEAEQAKIKDDAEWSVSQEVRDAWGIGGFSSNQDNVIHESSYLPFIFQSERGEGSSSGLQDDERTKLRGRRTFTARGREVVVEEVKAKPKEEGEVNEEEEAVAEAGDAVDQPRSRFEKLPKSISGFKTTISTRKDGKKSRTKTAQMLIHDEVSVRPPTAMQHPEAVPIPRNAVFVKPAGVDEPVLQPQRVTDARKRDREHALDADRPVSDGSKRKKRKETSSIS